MLLSYINDFLDRLVYLALRIVSMAVHSWGVDVSLELAKGVGESLKELKRARHSDPEGE